MPFEVGISVKIFIFSMYSASSRGREKAQNVSAQGLLQSSWC